MGAETSVAVRLRYMSDVVPVEQLQDSKHELLQANPPSVVELARSLSQLGKLLAGKELDPHEVYRQAAMINQDPPLPRDENFSTTPGMPPRRHHVVGEMFPAITLRDNKGLTTVETLLYVHVGDDPFNSTVTLGPKNNWSYDASGKRLDNSPIRDDKWWERIVWRKYIGPFDQEHVIEANHNAFAQDSEGNFWEIRTMKDHFRGNEYQEALQRAKVRPEAVRMAVGSLVKDLGISPLTAVPGPEPVVGVPEKHAA